MFDSDELSDLHAEEFDEVCTKCGKPASEESEMLFTHDPKKVAPFATFIVYGCGTCDIDQARDLALKKLLSQARHGGLVGYEYSTVVTPLSTTRFNR